MKVGVNTLFHIPGEVGGTETYLLETLRAMAERFPDTGLVLFASRDNHALLAERFAEFGQVECRVLSFRAANRPARILREQLQLPGVVKRSGADVLWSPGYTAVLRCPCPQAVTVHDMQYKTHPEDLSRSALTVTDFLVNHGCERAEAVIAVSAFSKSEIVKHTGVDAGKVFVTHEAADDSFGAAVEPLVAKELKARVLGFDDPYFLCVANTYPHKRVDLLVRAYAELEGRISHRLVLVGKPRRGEAAVQEALVQVSDRGRVKRLERVTHAELVFLYQQASAFVFPSAYEGFGLPVLEAMHAGTPVITSRSGSIGEVAGEAALFFDADTSGGLSELMLKAAELSETEHDALVRAGRAHALSFTWDRTADETMAVLMRVAEGK